MAEDWVSFEIHPHIPAGGVETIPFLEGLGYSNVPHLYDAIRQRAREVGITIGQVPRKYNTHLSLLLTEYAKDQGRAGAYNSKVFQAFWADGRAISDPAVLEEILTSIGLEFTAAMEGIVSGEYERRFVDQKALARRLGITAVPAFVLDQRYLISGAQPAEVFRQALRGSA